MKPRDHPTGPRTKVVIRYFAENLGTIHGTPLVPIRLDVSPSMKVSTLKYIACQATGLIEEMMALMMPKKPTSEEAKYFKPLWSPSDYRRQPFYGADASSMIHWFSRRRVDENLTISQLETRSFALSIDIKWLERCPVCGDRNTLSGAKRVTGFDNIPDLSGSFWCSNPTCNERKNRKNFDVRIGRWSSKHGTVYTLPLITAIANGASCAKICGSKTEPPISCSGPVAEIPELSKAEYCRCGAANPTGAHYCWNCGKKNKNVEPKPSLLLPYDLDELREQVRLEGGMAQSQTIGRSIAFVKELKRQGIIVEVTYCERCGAQNEATVARCRKCGKKISIDRTLKKPKKHKKPWWKFW